MRVARHGLLLLSTRSANTDKHVTALSPRNSRRGGGKLLNFIVIILSEELCYGAAFGTMCSWISNVGTYVHSIEHALGREPSDRCSREKVLRSISLGKDLRRRE